MSLEMARMASPGLVRWMIHRSPSTSTKLTTGTTSVIGSSFNCPKLMGVMSHSGWYTGRGRPENTTTEAFDEEGHGDGTDERRNARGVAQGPVGDAVHQDADGAGREDGPPPGHPQGRKNVVVP